MNISQCCLIKLENTPINRLNRTELIQEDIYSNDGIKALQCCKIGYPQESNESYTYTFR